ncbi:helix-hairpin-helix domain-containing protein [Companilactobacillus halodurans]|uniref:ComEA family DNA-binding protein n=1 Tax=Companilactobacillus halodurans TaxID=2584183 RepID=A0A5P0ZZK9_9LACO|nr:helix-hairpin-helix domain-containing protein [Companilactobacillus halodurans]MQS74912.1 ComEA family DNA-binding protein [Companilactobacillus halodurans]MQS98397.1 ComEA family DNA-binding protein [Companilactobacillus halodurans]
MEEVFSHIKQNIIVIAMILVMSIFGSLYFWTHKTKPVQNEIKTEVVTKDKEAPEKKQKINNDIFVVDIQGAVKNSGVYRVKKGTIVQDILQMAGGVMANADVKQINRAQKVTDQMQIYVPYTGETQVSPQNSANKGSGGGQKKVNINSAKADDFKDVSGIGPKKAEKIIAFREKNGNFKDLHDLTKVSGIGEKSLESLKDQLTV